MNFSWKKILEELRILFILIIVAFTVKSTLVEIYVVPTGSMENTILTGDMLIGNKFIYGMRTPTWIGLPWSRIGFEIPWFRLPEFKKVKNGDVTIFEFPRDPFQKYVKRCIGTPGDSIYIQSGEIIINGKIMDFPKEGKYTKGYVYGTEKIEKLYTLYSGNRDNINGFIVPYKGMVLDFSQISDWQNAIELLVQDGNEVKLFDSRKYLCRNDHFLTEKSCVEAGHIWSEVIKYKYFTMIDPNEVARTHGFLRNKLIRLMSSGRQAAMREQKERIRYINKLNKKNKQNNLVNPWHINYGFDNDDYLNDNIIVNGKRLRDLEEYTLKSDYYFFMGDNRDSSYDSRFWGFVPDSQILGTPLFAVINLFKLKLRLQIVS